MGNRVRITEVLVYYDGPQVVECRDAFGSSFIGLLTDVLHDKSQYHVIQVSQNRLDDLYRGDIDLRYLFMHPESDNSLFIMTSVDDGFDSIEFHSAELPIDESHLPLVGLNVLKDNYKLTTIARQESKFVFDIRLLPRYDPSLYRMDAKFVSSIISIVQRMFDHSRKKFLSSISNSDEKKRWKNDTKSSLVLEPAYKSSFGLRFVAVEDVYGLFGNSNYELFTHYIDTVINTDDADQMIDNLRHNSGHLASTIKDLLSEISRNECNITIEWASPAFDKPVVRKISMETAKQVLGRITDDMRIETQFEVFIGYFEMADHERGKWKLVEDDETISGKVEEDNFDLLRGIVISSQKYKVLCIETATFTTDSTSTKTEYIARHIEMITISE